MNQDSYWVNLDGVDFNLADVVHVHDRSKDSKAMISAVVTLRNGTVLNMDGSSHGLFKPIWSKYMAVMSRRWVDTTSIEWDKADDPDELQKIANADRLRYDKEYEAAQAAGKDHKE